MTKTELEKKLTEMQEQFDKMQKQINELKQVKVEEKPKEKWMPKSYEEYWFVSDTGEIYCSVWTNTHQNRWRYLTGNVFKTEQEAKEYKKKIEIQAQFRNFVQERNDELDWNDVKNKWYMYYSYYRKKYYFQKKFLKKLKVQFTHLLNKFSKMQSQKSERTASKNMY